MRSSYSESRNVQFAFISCGLNGSLPPIAKVTRTGENYFLLQRRIGYQGKWELCPGWYRMVSTGRAGGTARKRGNSPETSCFALFFKEHLFSDTSLVNSSEVGSTGDFLSNDWLSFVLIGLIGGFPRRERLVSLWLLFLDPFSGSRMWRARMGLPKKVPITNSSVLLHRRPSVVIIKSCLRFIFSGTGSCTIAPRRSGSGLVTPTGSLCVRFGSATDSLVFCSPHIPRPGRETISFSYATSPHAQCA